MPLGSPTHGSTQPSHPFANSVGRLNSEAKPHVMALPAFARAAEAKLAGDVHHLLDIDGSAEQRRIEAGGDV